MKIAGRQSWAKETANIRPHRNAIVGVAGNTGVREKRALRVGVEASRSGSERFAVYRVSCCVLGANKAINVPTMIQKYKVGPSVSGFAEGAAPVAIEYRRVPAPATVFARKKKNGDQVPISPDSIVFVQDVRAVVARQVALWKQA